jgi:RTX calcium-binding nonapeptide repeat (4 copies)
MRRSASCLLLVGVVVCATAFDAGSASAATLRLNVIQSPSLLHPEAWDAPPRGPLAALSYRSDGDQVDRIAVALEVVDGAALAYLVRAPADTSTGAGCSKLIQTERWRCPIPSGTLPVASIGLGDGNDSVSVSGAMPARAVLLGGRGNDLFSGGSRHYGGPGRDRLRAATDQRMSLNGGEGPDHLVGGGGPDEIHGGYGADFILPGRGHDTVLAGPGNDHIVAWENGGDHVDCGRGADIARVDGLDLVGPVPTLAGSAFRCERVARSTPARALPVDVWDESGGFPLIEIHCPWDLPLGCIAKVTLSIPGGPTLGSARLRMPAGDARRREFSPTEGALARLEDRGAQATVITYPQHGRPRKADMVFPFGVYTGD